jgi:D-serine deaminase-like pyridoxal phosphate-dependent protein
VTGPEDRYRSLARAVEAEPLPCAVVDLDALDINVHRLVGPARAAGKTLRIASKSLRCVPLLEHIQRRAPDVVQGVMCYAAREARVLFERGFDDLLLAYPTLQPADLELLAQLNRGAGTTRVVVDAREHVDALAEHARRAGSTIPLVIEVDGSYRPLGGRIHLGARRSPLHDPEAALALARHARRLEGVRVDGVMIYEAQIAGLGDQSPFSPLLNPAKAALRRRSRRPVAELRAKTRRTLEAAGFELAVVNGGGSGSLGWTCEEDAPTEVTAGSGFLDSHLFDYYRELDLEPAIFFALQSTRRPAPHLVTCHGGGYVASGEAGADRLPRPWLPGGLELLSMEGAGEVQTPLRVPPGLDLELGAPVFFRHAKAGELAEHFNTYLFVRGEEIVDRAPTYRGEGHAFL